MIDNVRATVAAMVDDGTLPGATWAVVLGPSRGGGVHVESAGVYDDDTMFRVASVTKPIAGLLALAVVEDGSMALDDPVQRWIPELAGRRVLRHPGAGLDDVVEPTRALTVADVLAMGVGLGYGTALEGSPLEAAAADGDLMSTWVPSPLSPDEWVRRLADLPMAHHPGDGWLYQSSFDLLSVLVERATGVAVDELMRSRILEPLGMHDTGWTVPADRLDRVPAQFFPTGDGALTQVAPAADPSLARRPAFCSLATGLVSTAPDLARLGVALLEGGGGVVSGSSVESMARDRLSPTVRSTATTFLGADVGWGFGVGVDLVAAHPGSCAGRFGWDGGTGTSMWTDPAADVSAVLLTQAGMTGPGGTDFMARFWAAVHG